MPKSCAAYRRFDLIIPSLIFSPLGGVVSSHQNGGSLAFLHRAPLAWWVTFRGGA